MKVARNFRKSFFSRKSYERGKKETRFISREYITSTRTE
jgi:hypothetical protein